MLGQAYSRHVKLKAFSRSLFSGDLLYFRSELSLFVMSRAKERRCPSLRSPSRALLISALLFNLAGCRSNTVVLDQRPAWVMEAEQRLQKDPVFKVDKQEARDSAPLWGRQPIRDASKMRKNLSGRKQPYPSRGRETSSKAKQPPETQPSSIAQPEAVSWGETKITVEVED